jgi:hypothetical protein
LWYWQRSLVPVYVRSRSETGSRKNPRPDLGESLARRFQLRRLPAKIRAMMNQDSRVVVTDQMLKFHDEDRRAEYRDSLKSLVASL